MCRYDFSPNRFTLNGFMTGIRSDSTNQSVQLIRLHWPSIGTYSIRVSQKESLQKSQIATTQEVGSLLDLFTFACCTWPIPAIDLPPSRLRCDRRADSERFRCLPISHNTQLPTHQCISHACRVTLSGHCSLTSPNYVFRVGLAPFSGCYLVSSIAPSALWYAISHSWPFLTSAGTPRS